MWTKNQMNIINNFKVKGYVVKERISDTHAEVVAIAVCGKETLLFKYSAEEAIEALLTVTTKKAV